MQNGYSNNVIKIGRDGNRYTIHQNGYHKSDLSIGQLQQMLTSYPLESVLQFAGNIPPKIKRQIRGFFAGIHG